MEKCLYAAGLSLVLASSGGVQAADKIAVINISSIFQQSPQRAMVAKQLENEFKGRVTELQFMERDLQKIMQRLLHDGSSMTLSDRSVLEKLVITQRETFSNKAQAFEQDQHRRQTEERTKILSRIREAVKHVAKKQGYDLVIDDTAVTYASNAKDITADVLKQVK